MTLVTIHDQMSQYLHQDQLLQYLHHDH